MQIFNFKFINFYPLNLSLSLKPFHHKHILNSKSKVNGAHILFSLKFEETKFIKINMPI